MSTRPGPPARPRGRGVVIRPAQHVQAVRADAIRAANENAAEYGYQPDYLIAGVIDWALGLVASAPFTGTPTPGGASAEHVTAEIGASRRHLESTSYSEQAADQLSRARHILAVLEWLTGVTDLPPTYTSGTQPGDLTDGRGPIVRSDPEMRRMYELARRQAAAEYTGWGSGPGWYEGVMATLAWAAGARADPPMAHPGGTLCSHPPSAGPPGADELRRERDAAEDHLQPGGYRHGAILPGYADAVACTLRWLHGQTVTPPAEDPDDQPGPAGPARLPAAPSTASRYDRPMSAQADERDGHDLIHLGGQTAVVVPLQEYLTLKALRDQASAEQLDDAVMQAAIDEHEQWKAAGRAGGTIPHGQVAAALLTR